MAILSPTSTGSSWAHSAKGRYETYGHSPIIEAFDRQDVVNYCGNGDRCIYCDGPFEQLDHMIPVSRSGSHALWNCLPSCQRCNLAGVSADDLNEKASSEASRIAKNQARMAHQRHDDGSLIMRLVYLTALRYDPALHGGRFGPGEMAWLLGVTEEEVEKELRGASPALVQRHSTTERIYLGGGRLARYERDAGNLSFADIRPTLGGAADARLGGNDYRVMLLALERITEYRFASFGRGELAELMDVHPSVVTRSIRRLKSAGIIKPSSDTANIYFAVDGDLDY